MNKIKKLLEISGIINIILSLLLITHISVWAVILLVTGMLLISYSFLSLEKLQKKKVALIIMTIIMFIFNFIVGILIILILDAIYTETKTINNNSPPETKEKITAETKKIDILLKVGLGMVITSGILFATTSWDIIVDPLKVIILLLMGIIFLSLSKFSEVKLKIRQTTIGYYILGLSFLLFSWIGIGYFGIFSNWFSYSGGGKNLVYFITFILISIVLYIISKKFSKKEYTYIAWMSIYLSIYQLLIFLGLTTLQVITILTAISILINIFSKEQSKIPVKDINRVASYIYWVLILGNCCKENFIIILIASILNIINLLYLSSKNKDNIYNVFTIIISYFLMISSIINIDLNIDKCLSILATVSIFSLILRLSKPTQQKTILNSNQILYLITSIILVTIVSTYDHGAKLLLVAGIQLFTNISNSINWYKNDYHKISYYTQPLVLALLAFCISIVIDANVFTFTLTSFLSLTCLIYATMHFFIKEATLKQEYFISFIVITILTYLINLITTDIFTSLVIIILSVYIYFSSNSLQQNKNFKLIAYLFILLNIHTAIYTVNVLSLPNFYNSLVVLLIYGILLLTINDKKLKVSTYIALLLPLYSMLNSAFNNEVIRQILLNLLQIYILLLIAKLFIKNKNIIDIVVSIGLIIIITQIIFITDILITLYVGLLGIIIIMISFTNKEYKMLFYTGIGITIGNIVIQLWAYWEQLPFWLYLLLAGISLIVVVTYKEMNKKGSLENTTDQNSNDSKETAKKINYQETKAEIDKDKKTFSKQNDIIYCPQCRTKNRGGKFCPNCGKNLSNLK